MRDAKLEAMGLAPQEDRRPRGERPQMATDEVVWKLVLLDNYELIFCSGHGALQEKNAQVKVPSLPANNLLLSFPASTWTLIRSFWATSR